MNARDRGDLRAELRQRASGNPPGCGDLRKKTRSIGIKRQHPACKVLLEHNLDRGFQRGPASTPRQELDSAQDLGLRDGCREQSGRRFSPKPLEDAPFGAVFFMYFANMLTKCVIKGTPSGILPRSQCGSLSPNSSGSILSRRND